MSDSLAQALAAYTSASEQMDYAKAGIHARHTTTLEHVLSVGKTFLDAGYILEMLTCQDLREKEEVMRLCYTFNSLESVNRHLVHVDIAGGLDAETFEAPTMSKLAGGANWQEREVFEMYGVTFTEHPELERLLLPEDADFFPLRKDFGRIEDAEDADA
jgi:NADH-quinone oxidoreductase subunit C